jgi:hypothetical protein
MLLAKVSVLPLNDRSDAPTVPTTPLIETLPLDVTLAIEGDVIIAGMMSLSVTSKAVVSLAAFPLVIVIWYSITSWLSPLVVAAKDPDRVTLRTSLPVVNVGSTIVTLAAETAAIVVALFCHDSCAEFVRV